MLKGLTIHARKRILFLLSAIIGWSIHLLQAQSVLSTPPKQGQIHLQLDRSVYARGETIWFNAYLSADEGISVGSTLQAELWKEDSLCLRMQYPVALGVSSGQFTLSAKCTTGWYTIKAFTEQASLKPFQTYVYIVGKESPGRSTFNTKDSVQLIFFPEGGQLVEGIESHIAFKAMDQHGKPASVTGAIRNTQGITVTTFSTWHHGMGEFYLRPELGQSYYAEWNEMGTIKRQSLTPAKTKGTVLSLIDHPEGFMFELNSNIKDSLPLGRWLLGTREGKEVFRLPLSPKTNSLQGLLKTKQLSSGVLQISVIDSDGSTVVTRNVFVNNKEYRTTFSLRTDTLTTGKKEKNKWTLQWPDSLTGSMSIAITDADLDKSHYAHPSIVAHTLLTKELFDQVYRPDWYFTTTEDSASIGLDLLMMTNKGHSDSATRPPTISESNSEKNNKKGYITIQGQAFFRDTRQPLANAKLIVVLSAPRIRNNILFTETDQYGRFSIDSLLFFGPVRLIFAEHRPQKKSRPIDIKLDATSLPSLVAASNWSRPNLPPLQTPLQQGDAAWLQKMDELVREAEGVTLEEVTIKTRTKSPLEKLQEEYTRGAFETDAFVERVIDLVNTDEATTYPNIFEYIRFRIPGLQVVDPDYSKSPPTLGQSGGFEMQNDPTKYRIFYRQLPSASGMGNPPMVIYLNEVEVDADILLTIPTAEIALVKLFSSFAAAQGGGPGGALAIYTKKIELLKQNSGSAVTFTGYSGIQTFPELHYNTSPELRNNFDGRITLFWRSALFLNGERGRFPIEFYNSDRTKRFRIVVEGLTSTGQPLLMEKIVEQNPQ